MEEQPLPEEPSNPEQGVTRIPTEAFQKRPEVIIVRNWKEYVGESLLIIFSVGLALILTELVNRANETRQFRELENTLRQELMHNRDEVKKQYEYHLTILQRIDSGLKFPPYASRIISNNEFHVEILAPHGLLYGDIEDAAWQVAKSRNIASRLDIPTLSLLTSIYKDQEKISKVEDEVGKIILGADSRKDENIPLTLLLIRDNYRGWATYRVPDLLDKYQIAINKLGTP
jgi:hypothetical protein